jgi:acyl carrier protein
VAKISGTEPRALDADTRLGDALGSLDRVELATRLEMTYGVPLPPESAAPERRLGDLVAELSEAAGSGTSNRSERGGGGEAARAATRAVPEARWRSWPPVRALRFALAQGVLRPAWRSLIALDAAGVDRLARIDPPFLLASNHLSILDPGAVLFALPPRLSSKVATTAMWERFERSRAGSLQYACTHLGTQLVMVLGHENCGAVEAALASKFAGAQQRSRIEWVLQTMLPGLDAIDPQLPPQRQMACAVEANVRWTMRQILDSPEGRERVVEGRIKVTGAVCEIASGRVRLLA